MNKLQKRVQQRGQGGFTLIELLVVIAILAILAGVVVFAVGNSTDNAKETACKAEAKTWSVAANAAKAQHLNEAANTTKFTDYLDGGTAAVSGSKYFTATETLTGAGAGVDFGIKAGVTLPGSCAQPTDVTY